PFDQKAFQLAISKGTNKTLSVYEWRDLRGLDYSSYGSQLNKLRSKGFNQIFLNLNYFVDINEQSDQSQKAQQTKEFQTSLAKYLDLASNNGFKVQAVVGAENWSS